MAGERRLISFKSLVESIGLKIASIAGTVATSTTITNNPLDIRQQPVGLTFNQSVTSLNAVSQTILAANSARKYLLIRNSSTSDALVYIRLAASAATLTNSLPLRKGEYYESPEDFTYTGAITAISSAFGSDSVAVMEGF